MTLDVSVLVRPGMHIWTGNPGLSLTQTSFLAQGDTANVSKLCCGVHTGTHVDAPCHFIDGAEGVETLDIDALCGPALVVDLRHLDDEIDAASLASPRPERRHPDRLRDAKLATVGSWTRSRSTSSRSRRVRRSSSSIRASGSSASTTSRSARRRRTESCSRPASFAWRGWT